MLYVLEVETEGAAFGSAHLEKETDLEGEARELARILRAEADELDQYGVTPHAVRDVNGNTCGAVLQVLGGEADEPKHRTETMRLVGAIHRLPADRIMAKEIPHLEAAAEDLRAKLAMARKESDDRNQWDQRPAPVVVGLSRIVNGLDVDELDDQEADDLEEVARALYAKAHEVRAMERMRARAEGES